MSQSKAALMVGFLSALASVNHETPIPREYKNKALRSKPDPFPETESEKARRRGLKEWNFDGEIIYAATKKAALKKLNRNK